MLMFGMSLPSCFFPLSFICDPFCLLSSFLSSDREETLTYRYFAAKAFEKTTGDMSEPMGESISFNESDRSKNQ